MPWSSHVVREKFQAFVNSVVGFHNEYGKNKNQEEFGKIRLACEAALDFLFADVMPKGADQIVSSLSTGIFQTLILIGAKKTGGEDNAEFIQGLLETNRELSLFRNASEQEIAKKEHENDVKDKSEHLIESEPVTKALTHLDDKEELAEKIASLGDMPAQHFSLFSFFKRAVTHYPKTTISSVLTGSVGLSYTALCVLSHYLGDSLDAMMKSDVTGVSHQAVIATLLLLTAGTLGTTALLRTYGSLPNEDREEQLNERSRLLPV